jgi:hypothetical protein
MKKRQLSLLIALFSVSFLSQLAFGQAVDTLFKNDQLWGISNAVVYDGQAHYVAAYDPASGFSGYPNPNSQFGKLSLRNEQGELSEFESESVAASPEHSHLAQTPDGNLAYVYQAPTGTGYGFRMPFKVWDGQNVITDELIFANNNWGAWGRILFDGEGEPHVISFAHSGYYLLEHSKNGSGWNNDYISGPNEYFSHLSVDRYLGSSFIAGAFRPSSGAPRTMRVYHNVSNSWAYLNVDDDDSRSCDIEIDEEGQLHILYSTENELKLATGSVDEVTVETVWVDTAIHTRADLFLDGGTINVAYQNEHTVRVVRKSDGDWEEIFLHENLTDPEATIKPTLAEKEGQLIVLYNDDQNVYLGNIGVAVNTSDRQRSNQNEMEVYPNPSSDFIRVNVHNLDTSGTIRILDASGAVVYSRHLLGQNATVDVSSLPAGKYWVLAETAKGVLTSSFIKQ